MSKDFKCELTHNKVREILVEYLCRKHDHTLDEAKVIASTMDIQEHKFVIGIKQQ